MVKNNTQDTQGKGGRKSKPGAEHHNYYLRRIAGPGKVIGEYVSRATLANMLAQTAVSELKRGQKPRYEPSPRYTSEATSEKTLTLRHTPPGVYVAVNTLDYALGMIEDPAVRAMFAVRAAAALSDVFMDATQYAMEASKQQAAGD